MRVTVNGESRDVADGATLAGVVAEVTDASSGVAVALNGDIVARGAWPRTRLREADRIEVLTATQGG